MKGADVEGGRGETKVYELDGESGEDGVSFSLSCEVGVRVKESPSSTCLKASISALCSCVS